MPFAELPLDIWTAAERGLLEVVKGFVAAGLPVDARSRQDFTPLHMAVRAGHVEAVKWLLDNGANINGRTKPQPGYPGAETPLCLAVESRRSEMAELLLRRGADPNLKSSDGTSVLEIAAQTGDLNLVSLLVTRGANLNPRGESNPLLNALCAKQLTVATYLSEHGARIDAKVPPYRGSMLMTVANSKWLSGVEFLLSRGAEVNQKDGEGRTALHYGVLGFGSRQLTWMKTEHGEKCIREEPEEAIPIVKRLLEAGADPAIRDKSGFTPLDYAKKIRAEAIIKLLEPMTPVTPK